MLKEFFSVSRFHIVLIAAGGSLVFGWLLTGNFLPALALVVALDWFLVNIVNRVVDQTEDLENRIHATEYAHQNRRRIYALALALYVLSFSIHFFWRPELLVPRLAYHFLGLIYNFRIIPAAGGRSVRLKELFFLKNMASNMGFLLTVIAYPLTAYALRPEIGAAYILLLIAYFAPFETSFEVIYDLRDVKGDRAAGVASYPVVKGDEWSGRLILVLNIVSIFALLTGAVAGLFGLKEFILIFGPLIQLMLFVHGRNRGFRPADCVRITWTFAAMNFIYCAWVLMGFPITCPFEVTLPLIVEVGLAVIGVVIWVWLKDQYGPRRIASLYGLLMLGAWLAEDSAIRLYDFYSYDPMWGLFADKTPVAIVLIWPMVIITTHHLMRRFGLSGVRTVAYGALMVAFEAVLVEVVCANAGLWHWRGDGLFSVPLIGIVGWGCFALGAMTAVEFFYGKSVLWLPVLGLISTHVLLQILWRLGFRWISYTKIPSALVIDVMILACVLMTEAAWRYRDKIRISMTEIVPRVLAAQLMYYMLFVSKPDPALLTFCCLFIPPYMVMPVYEWVAPGQRGPFLRKTGKDMG